VEVTRGRRYLVQTKSVAGSSDGRPVRRLNLISRGSRFRTPINVQESRGDKHTIAPTNINAMGRTFQKGWPRNHLLASVWCVPATGGQTSTPLVLETGAESLVAAGTLERSGVQVARRRHGTPPRHFRRVRRQRGQHSGVGRHRGQGAGADPPAGPRGRARPSSWRQHAEQPRWGSTAGTDALPAHGGYVPTTNAVSYTFRGQTTADRDVPRR
jgi:hypothetical protein